LCRKVPFEIENLLITRHGVSLVAETIPGVVVIEAPCRRKSPT
jgi:hypothetical protein